MHIQLQFKSFYKLHNKSLINNPDTKKKNSGINLLPFLLLLLLSKFKKESKKFQTAANTTIFSSSFYPPIKKKSIIFLRAPYKNKLARLNILRFEFTVIMSLKINTKNITNNKNLLNLLNKFVFSTHKLKHIKTKIKYNEIQKFNFKIRNFN